MTSSAAKVRAVADGDSKVRGKVSMNELFETRSSSSETGPVRILSTSSRTILVASAMVGFFEAKPISKSPGPLRLRGRGRIPPRGAKPSEAGHRERRPLADAPLGCGEREGPRSRREADRGR